MATLTNTKIKDTYDGLLKTTDNEALDVSGVTLIEDGLGNASALSVGRSGNGVTITGSLNATLATAAQPNITSVGTLSSLSVSGNLAVDTNTLYVDAANNRVGIGTSSPETDLEIENTNPTIIVNDDRVGGGLLRFSAGSSANTYIQAGTELTSGSSANIIFGSIYGANEWMRIDSSGNVGIGESNPARVVHIKNSVPAIRLEDSDVSGLYHEILATAAGEFQFKADGGNVQASSSFTFAVDGSEKVRIDSSGNVGIGESNPADILSLKESDSTVFSSSSTSATRQILIKNSNTTSGVAAGIVLDAQGAGSSGVATLHCVDAGSARGDMVFGTRGSDGTAERMRITSGGYLWATSTSAVPSLDRHQMASGRNGNSVLDLLHTNSSSPYGLGIQFLNSAPNNSTTEWFINALDNAGGGTTRFRVWSNGNVVNANNSYGAISDAKLKENVVDASPKLDDLLQVKVRNFNYIGDDKKQLGVVAQELESIFPSMIDESIDFEEQEVIDEEGNVTKERVDLGTTTKSVKYSVFVPMLIKAMQEQQEIINDLKARIETLEAK